MSTYSTNFGNPAIEATNWNSLQKIMEGMPNNTAQLITPQHVRDAVYTTWEQGVFKVLEVGNINYIGTDNGGTTNNFRHKMFFGKRELGLGNNIMDNALLSSDTDIFFYNNKSDSNPSLQDTKISFLAGSDFTLFQNAPYLGASQSLNSIDLNIINPSSGGGIISIDSDFIELGSRGWNINNLNGDLYPVVDGSNIGRTGSNRIGTIYMASTIDYLNDLIFKSGTSSIIFDTDGKITTKSLYVTGDLKFQNIQTPGYFLSTDGLGNSTWQPGSIDTSGQTHGNVLIADGSTGIIWTKRLADDIGIPEGYILTSSGTSTPFNPNSPNTTGIPTPEYKPIWDIKVPASSNGLVLGSNGSTTEWVSSVTGASGSDGSIQFSSSGFLDSDNELHWDNNNKRLGINMNNPEYEIDVDGTVRSTIGLFPDLISTNGTFSNSLNASVGTIDILTVIDVVNTKDISIDGIFHKGGTTSNGHVLTSDAGGYGTWQLPTNYPSNGNQYNIQLSDGNNGFSSDNNLSFSTNILRVGGSVNIVPSLAGTSISDGLSIKYPGMTVKSWNFSHTFSNDPLLSTYFDMDLAEISIPLPTYLGASKTYSYWVKISAKKRNPSQSYSCDYYISYDELLDQLGTPIKREYYNGSVQPFSFDIITLSPNTNSKKLVLEFGSSGEWFISIYLEEQRSRINSQ